MITHITLIPFEEFRRIHKADIDQYKKLEILADMCRANALASVKKAGSGHLGSSFSSLDIVTALYYSEMNTVEVGTENPDRDIYFSSKGHDAPGLYAVLFSLGILDKNSFMRLRRLGGPCGHPDIHTPGIEANTGSLGMGISKGKGIAYAKRLGGHKGRVFVMTGDGELQEGQIFEALQTAARQRITNLNVIVDHNKVQSDKPVKEITDLGDLLTKFRSFGWHVARCNGHDYKQLESVFRKFRKIKNKPKILIADTIKGQGVSFMKHPAGLKAAKGIYKWHAGAPDDRSFSSGYKEIVTRINKNLEKFRLSKLKLEEISMEGRSGKTASLEYICDAYGQALLDISAKRKDLVVLDADLASDCRIRTFELKYPERFIENGIAEQDMVSMAGGLARQGLLPVVNTFASFLAARANEQIYNNACEKTKIIYAAHYAGLIPAGPGASHQSIRDIALLGALPNFVILEPCNARETRMILEYCVTQAKDNCVIRLVIGPSPRAIELPADYRLEPGCGVTLTDGSNAILFAYGPVMLHEALSAAEILRQDNFHLKVVNMPWLNCVNTKWLSDVASSSPAIYVLEDHAPTGGLGDRILNALVSMPWFKGRYFKKMAVEGYPACGTPQEVLQYHRLDGASLATRILEKTDPAVSGYAKATTSEEVAPNFTSRK